ncbi:MAG TPA: HD domain-containing protein [Chitinophagales bacterium]|nr:HD domain-containing protein [Chitinophagales bacterium]HMY24571.1 HD domain-containing protein [Chitinophagales bacterium]HMZ33948.1 HD domain-containing protein [Chitinophagales bacterium]HNG72661.1 HD domain-containing protein [Chitinophagales bacterium]HNL57658.1 HD domain-containing protein [Chitinophagales bacterium]
MQLQFTPRENELLQIVASIADELQVEAYVVGGFVRDKILQRNCKDIDIVCVGSGIELAKKVAESMSPKPHVSYFKNFGTAQIKLNDIELEFVGARKESYRRESRKPIVEDGTLEDDQNRRDFTINALAAALSAKNYGQVIDPFSGLEDLKNGIIRTPLNPAITFDDDPLRMMRAIRFASQLNFKIEEKTYLAIEPLAERLKIISQERISDELNKIIMSKMPSIGFKLLFNTKLLHQFFPEMVKLHGVAQQDNYGHKDNFYHTLKVLDNIAQNTDDLWLRWSAIMHDIAKPATQRFEQGHGWTFHGHEVVGARWTQKIFSRLKLPLDEKMKFVQKMVALHLRPISLSKDNITDSAIRRILYDAGDDIESLMLLCDADITSKNEVKVKRYKENLKLVLQKIKEVEERDHIRNWQPPISGEIIMQTFNIKPSREVGIIKDAIKDAILDGEIQNDFDAAFQLMLQKGKALNLTIS